MVWPSARLALGVSAAAVCGVVGMVRASSPAAAPVTASLRQRGTFFDGELAAEAARLSASRRRPEAVAPLLAVAALYDAVPPGEIEVILTEVAEAKDTDPLVAAQAAFLLARIEDDRGPQGAGDRRRAGLGLLTSFWVVGPFGDGRASFGEAFGPERDQGRPDPGRRYPGKEREVSWRSGAEVIRQGALYLDGLLRPEAQTAGYAMTFVRSERAAAAALRLGSPGPVKVWINGALAHARDLVRSAAFDQDAIGINLRAGWNRILIKTVVIDGAWRLFARLTDPSGRVLSFTQADQLPPGVVPGPAATATKAPPVAVRSLEEGLRRRAQAASAGPPAADAWFDLGRFRAWNQAGDREAREDAAAFEASVARRPSARALLRLSEAARDEDERRRTLERDRASDQPHSPVRWADQQAGQTGRIPCPAGGRRPGRSAAGARDRRPEPHRGLRREGRDSRLVRPVAGQNVHALSGRFLGR